MYKVKILKLCNEIEDVACDIARITMNDIVSAESRMIFDKAKEIAAEITAPPKSNGDRIRQMTDEELAEFLCLVKDKLCFACSYEHAHHCEGISCEKARLEWLRKEADEDAGTD